MLKLLKILTYCLISGIIYFTCRDRRKVFHISFGRQRYSSNQNIKIGVFSVIFLSILFGLYSTIVSQIPYSSDRGNYVRRFVGYWENPWTTGLNRLADFVHLFSNDPNALFFAVSFLSCFLFLLCYRMTEQADRKTVLLGVCSQLLIYSFYLLKQAPAIILGAMAITFLLDRKSVGCVICTVFAVMFHEASYILIPLYFLIVASNNKRLRFISYFAMALALFAFSGISRISFTLISRYMPDLYEQSESYLDSTNAFRSGLNMLTAIKGVPYYLITLFGIWKRKELINKIDHYDQYLTISAFASVAILLSTAMYWMSRFGTYAFFHSFVFASEIYRTMNNRRNANIFFQAVGGSLAFFTLRYLYQIFFWFGGF